MDEVPNAHEILVAKIQRHTDNDSSSESSETNEEQQLAPATELESPTNVQPQQLGIYLLEPLILLLLFAYNFSSTVLKNQIIYQTCTSAFGYPNAVCMLLGTRNASNETKRIETEVQSYAARVFLSIKIVESIVPALCGLFVGAWADRYGRKPLLLASYLGYALQYIISAFIAQQALQYHGMVSPWYYLLPIIPLSCLGSSITYSVAAVCFIGDVSVGKARSYRMILYELCIYLGLTLGAFSSGYAYEATTAYIVFAISAAVILCALIIMLWFLPESLPAATTVEHSQGLWSGTHFMQLLKDLWLTCAKPREFQDRSIVILVMMTLLLTTFVADGSNAVFYMFIREKFDWTVRQYTTYETISILVPAVAGSAGMLFLWSLRKCTNAAVLWLALISLFSHMTSSLTKAFAFVDWQIYLAIGLGVFKSLVNPMCRTIIANLLPTEERGKIFSMLSVLQSLTPFVSSTLYYVIYSMTLSSFAGLFNLISANLFCVAITLLLVVWRKKTNNRTYYEQVFK